MTLIRQLRKKFIIIIMSVFSGLVLFLFLLSVSAFRINQISFQKKILNSLIQSKGILDTQFISMLPPDLRSVRYAYAQVTINPSPEDDTQSLLQTRREEAKSFSEPLMQPYLRNETGLDRGQTTRLFLQVINRRANSGTVENFSYLKRRNGNELILCILDTSALRATFGTLVRHSAILIVISLFIIYGVSSVLSMRAILPAQEALDRQKQFISDASHEIKTPLAVMQAQISALELELASLGQGAGTADGEGANRWITNIKSEINRLSALTQNLLTLTRLESIDVQTVLEPLDYSTLLHSILLSFEARAYECGKQFSFDIETGIRVTGNSRQLEQLALILLDNALKYSNSGGVIEAHLARNAHKAVFSVYNTGEGISEQEKNLIFERFYRSDRSRSRDTDGFGLGLSIAGEIASRHKTKISIQGETGSWVRFSFSLPILT